MAVSTISVTPNGWDHKMARAINSNDINDLLKAIGDMQTSVAMRIGEVRVDIAGLISNQAGFQREMLAVNESMREMRTEMSSIRTDKAPRHELENLAKRITEQLAEKANSADFEQQGQLLENLGARIDVMNDKLDAIGVIEAVVQKNQLRVDQLELRVDPLTSENTKSQGRREAMRWVWIVLAALVGWSIAITGMVMRGK